MYFESTVTANMRKVHRRHGGGESMSLITTPISDLSRAEDWMGCITERQSDTKMNLLRSSSRVRVTALLMASAYDIPRTVTSSINLMRVARQFLSWPMIMISTPILDEEEKNVASILMTIIPSGG